MGNVVRLTESDLNRLIRKIIKEQSEPTSDANSKNWELISNSLKPSSQKNIKMRDGDISLNWGSHSGPGYDWGLSLSKRGTFAFQTENPEKAELVKSLLKNNGIPFEVDSYTRTDGKTSFSSNSKTKNIYDIPSSKLISFIKDLIFNLKEKPKKNI